MTVARLDAGAGEAGGQPFGARQIRGMRDPLVIESESQSIRIKTRIAFDDVEQREVTQPHEEPPLGDLYGAYRDRSKMRSPRHGTTGLHIPLRVDVNKLVELGRFFHQLNPQRFQGLRGG